MSVGGIKESIIEGNLQVANFQNGEAQRCYKFLTHAVIIKIKTYMDMNWYVILIAWILSDEAVSL
jgi:hypothetical protein